MEKIKVIQKEGFEVICSAVDKIVNLISPTYGPAGNKVIISKVTHGAVLDDGVQIARDLELSDPSENAVMKVVRETAIKTNDRVGDGTTGALIILQAIIQEVAKMSVRNGRKIEKELKQGFKEAKEQLLAEAKPVVTQNDLLAAARISFDDEEISEKIADAWYKLGKDGILTVDRSDTMKTEVVLKEGITINRGYISPYMITNGDRMEAVVEKPIILFTDYRLTEAKDVVGIMGKLLKEKITNLVIIAENIEQSALATLIVNKAQGKFSCVAVNAPAGENKTNLLEDMALMCGGKLFSEKKGDKIEDANVEDLGRADKFIAKSNESTIIGPKGDQEAIKKAIEELKSAKELEEKENVKEIIGKRIANFTNKVGVIKVGAATENEAKALRYKVEDAVNATRAAYRGGVVAGGGIGLLSLDTSSKLLNNALKVPFEQLKENVGMVKYKKEISLKNLFVEGKLLKLVKEPAHRRLNEGEAINVVTEEIGPWQEVGVVDPVDVLIAQIEGAVSIATLLVTTSGMIVENPQHLRQEG